MPEDVVKTFYHHSDHGQEFRQLHENFLGLLEATGGQNPAVVKKRSIKDDASANPTPTKRLKLDSSQERPLAEMPTATTLAEALS